jgi:hypothetical protein
VNTYFPVIDVIMSQPDLFDYSLVGSIHEEGHAIRLVQLIKGDGYEIECHLLKAFVNEVGIPYEALSYAWGDTAKTKQILLNNRRFLVTENLFIALQHLRLEDEDRILWIDAICIDQTQNLERNHQIMHMASIYREAETVLFWLGPSTPSQNLLMHSLKTLERRAYKMDCASWKPDDSRWRDLWSSTGPGGSLEDDMRSAFKTMLKNPVV